MQPVRVTSKDQVQARFEQVTAVGGDGVILRKSGSKYMEHNSFFKLEVGLFHRMVTATKETIYPSCGTFSACRRPEVHGVRQMLLCLQALVLRATSMMCQWNEEHCLLVVQW